MDLPAQGVGSNGPFREQWTLCREQWTVCREHVNRNTVHAKSTLLTSWLSESGVLTKRHAKYAKRVGARTGIENLCSKDYLIRFSCGVRCVKSDWIRSQERPNRKYSIRWIFPIRNPVVCDAQTHVWSADYHMKQNNIQSESELTEDGSITNRNEHMSWYSTKGFGH